MKLFRTRVRTTNSLQPGDTFWKQEILYCGLNRDEARIAYHKSQPGDCGRDFGNSARETVLELIDEDEVVTRIDREETRSLF